MLVSITHTPTSSVFGGSESNSLDLVYYAWWIIMETSSKP
jgi:hypothetical protein